jgi:hypothetical protein
MICQAICNSIKDRVRESQQRWSISPSTNAIAHVEIFGDRCLVKPHQNFDGILQVAIYDTDILASGERESDGYRRLVSKVSTQANAEDSGVLAVLLSD